MVSGHTSILLVVLLVVRIPTLFRYQHMPLTDTFVKQYKHSGKAAGDKHSDGGGLYLHTTATGKYWRMAYRFAGKQKTLAIGVYPAVTLAQARKRRDEAKVLLADGQDPSIAKREAKIAQQTFVGNTFEKITEQWLKATAADRKENTQQKVENWLNKDVLPLLGKLPIASLGPRDVLAVARKMEERGAIDSSKRVVQICGQIFRYAVAEGSAERDVTQDLRGALQ